MPITITSNNEGDAMLHQSEMNGGPATGVMIASPRGNYQPQHQMVLPAQRFVTMSPQVPPTQSLVPYVTARNTRMNSGLSSTNPTEVYCSDNDEFEEEYSVGESMSPSSHFSPLYKRRDFLHRILKYTIFTFNLVFCIIGLLLLGFGIWGETSKSSDVKNSEFLAIIRAYSLIFIIVGCITTVTSICGCSGAICTNACYLTVYFLILLGLFIAHIVMGSQLLSGDQYLYMNDTMKLPALLTRDEWLETRTSPLKVELKLYEEQKINESASELTRIEREYNCCGLYGKEDYKMIKSDACRNNIKKKISELVAKGEAINDHNLKIPGCMGYLMTMRHEGQEDLAVLVICLSAIFPIGMILVVSLCCTYKLKGPSKKNRKPTAPRERYPSFDSIDSRNLHEDDEAFQVINQSTRPLTEPIYRNSLPRRSSSKSPYLGTSPPRLSKSHQNLNHERQNSRTSSFSSINKRRARDERNKGSPSIQRTTLPTNYNRNSNRLSLDQQQMRPYRLSMRTSQSQNYSPPLVKRENKPPPPPIPPSPMLSSTPSPPLRQNYMDPNENTYKLPGECDNNDNELQPMASATFRVSPASSLVSNETTMINQPSTRRRPTKKAPPPPPGMRPKRPSITPSSSSSSRLAPPTVDNHIGNNINNNNQHLKPIIPTNIRGTSPKPAIPKKPARLLGNSSKIVNSEEVEVN